MLRHEIIPIDTRTRYELYLFLQKRTRGGGGVVRLRDGGGITILQGNMLRGQQIGVTSANNLVLSISVVATGKPLLQSRTGVSTRRGRCDEWYRPLIHHSVESGTATELQLAGTVHQ